MSGRNKEQEEILMKIVQHLKNVAGVEAVVFGGSRVIGTAADDSNIDIGIYYLAEGVLDLDLLEETLADLDDLHREHLLALPGTWGEWLNGGSCLKVNGVVIDISLRSISRVNQIIDMSKKGDITIAYQFGHPFGFVSTMYLAEVDCCKILFEKKRAVTDLKRRVRPFDPIYKKAAIEHFLWECDYSSTSGKRCIARKDIVYAVGALYKCVNSLCQVIYAMNSEYLLNEKSCLDRMVTFKIVPNDFEKNMKLIFSALDENNIEKAFGVIDYYSNEIKTLMQTVK